MRIAATSTEPNPWSGTTPPQGAATARIRIRNALDRTLHRATHPGGGCGPRIRHQHRPLQWTVPHRTSGQCLTQRERSEWEHVVLPHRPRLGATEIPKPRCFIRNMSNGRRRMWARVLVPRSTRSGRIHDRPPGNTIPQFQRQCACTLSICNCCMLPCPATPLTLWRAWNFTRRPPNARRTEQWEAVRLLGG